MLDFIKIIGITLSSIVAIISISLFMIYKLQEKIIFNPEKLTQNYKFHFDYPFHESKLIVDKFIISCITIKQEKPKGIIIFFSGNSFSMNYWVSSYASILYPTGYDICFFDYPGFGKSSHQIESEKQLTKIGTAVLNYKVNEDLYNKNIIIYGVSFGTGLACKSINFVLKPKLVILEAPFFDFLSIASYYYSFLPAKLLLKYTFNNAKIVEKSTLPIYLFHGDADETIPYYFSEKLTTLNKAMVSLYTIPNAAHSDLVKDNGAIKELQKIIITS